MSNHTRKNRKSLKRNTKKCWGYHLIVNAGDCTPSAIRNKKMIANFAKDLVKEIDMVAFGVPMIVMFGKGAQKGYTLVQLIETSNITAHFAEDTNDIYLDVFSCKTFNPKLVFPILKKYFHPKKMNTKFFTRQA